MQDSTTGPEIQALLDALPGSQGEIAARARAMAKRGAPEQAEALLAQAERRCPTRAVQEARAAILPAIRPSAPPPANLPGDPPTDEMEALDLSDLAVMEVDDDDPDTSEVLISGARTAESVSLELNAFRREDGLDNSDVFGAGSFSSLSSLMHLGADTEAWEEAAPDAHDAPGAQADSTEARVLTQDSVDSLLVDLGVALGDAEKDDDPNATRSLRGRIDELPGLQRDDLRADNQALAPAAAEWDDLGDTEFRPPADSDGPTNPEDASARAAGLDPRDWEDAGDTEFLAQVPADESTDPEDASARAAGLDPRDWEDAGDTEFLAPAYADESAPGPPTQGEWDDDGATEFLTLPERGATTHPRRDSAHLSPPDPNEWDDAQATAFLARPRRDAGPPRPAQPARVPPAEMQADDWDDGGATEFLVQDRAAEPIAELSSDWLLDDGGDDTPQSADRPPGALEDDVIPGLQRNLDFAADAGQFAPPASARRTPAAGGSLGDDFAAGANLLDAQTPVPAAHATHVDSLATPRPETPATRANPPVQATMRYAKFIVPAVLLLLLIGVVGAAGAASSSAASAVEQKVEDWRLLQTADTYQNYLLGEAALSEAMDARGFLGGPLESLLGSVGLMGDAQAARADARAELAFVRAMVEYRYEYAGARRAAQTIESAAKSAGADVRLEVARAYVLLSQSKLSEAVAVLTQTRQTFPSSALAEAALIHAYLDAGNAESAAMTALPLQNAAGLSIHQHYLLALVDQQRGKMVTADGRFRHILQTLNPNHISARIGRSQSVRALNEADADKVAGMLLEEVFGALRAQASPLQLAEAHIARGQISLGRADRAAAQTDFQDAIKLIPQRSKVYPALISLFIGDGRLDTALKLIQDASAAGVSAPTLVLQMAQIYALSARAETGIETIDAAELTDARAWWLKGTMFLDLGQRTEARAAFEQALTKDELFPPARAYLLLVELLGASPTPDALDGSFETLLDRAPEDPDVLRAAALSLMKLAEGSDSAAARTQVLERAETLLTSARRHGANPAIILFDRCRQAQLKPDVASALRLCDEAIKLNPRYLPGVQQMAQLLLVSGGDAQSETFFTRVGEDFAADATLSHYRALSFLERYDLPRAEAEVNRWAGSPLARGAMHLYSEGRLAFARRDYRAALGYFQSAHTDAPAMSEATLYLAQTLARLGELTQAEQALKPVLNDAQWGAAAWVVFSEIRRLKNRLGDARQNLNIAMKRLDGATVSPRRITQAHVESALILAAQHGFAHPLVARELERAAQAGDPDLPELNMALSRHHLAQRNPERAAAARALEKVIAREPFHCSALQSLQSIYKDLDAARNLERVEAQLTDKKCRSVTP